LTYTVAKPTEIVSVYKGVAKEKGQGTCLPIVSDAKN